MRGFDQGQKPALDRVQQRVLLDEILDGVAGQAELGEYGDRRALVVTGPRRGQDRRRIGGGIGDAGGRDTGRDAGEAVPVDRMEVHRVSPSPVVRSYDM